MLIALLVPADNLRGPVYLEQVIDGLYSGLRPGLTVTLGFAQIGDTVNLYCRFPDQLQSVIESGLHAAYPNAELHTLDENMLRVAPELQTRSTWLWLSPDVFPIQRHREFADDDNRVLADPISAVLQGLASNQQALVELTLNRVGRLRKRRAEMLVYWLHSKFLRSHPVISETFARTACSQSACLRRVSDILGILVGRVIDPSDADRFGSLTIVTR